MVTANNRQLKGEGLRGRGVPPFPANRSQQAAAWGRRHKAWLRQQAIALFSG